jgi:outer membrane lipoprotein
MTTLLRACLLFALTLLLGACAGGPSFDTRGVDRSLTPAVVALEPDRSRGKSVLWGGVILATANLSDRTRIEALAYPMDGNNRPKVSEDPLGRFVVEQRGYLEPASYAQGRWITVAGSVAGVRGGKVGESDYSYPVVDARRIHLWSKDSMRGNTDLHFGIGVGIIF